MTTLTEPELFNGYGHPVRFPDSHYERALRIAVEDRVAELWRWRAWYRSRPDWSSFTELRRQHAAELRALVQIARQARALSR